jgi:DNA-binding XRE family transcriptional regulator
LFFNALNACLFRYFIKRKTMIKNRIKEKRNKAGFTQEELAGKVGVRR